MRVTDVGQLFHYLAHVNHAVDWDNLREAVSQTAPITERERCELLLRAANGQRLSGVEWHRLLGVELVPGLRTGAWAMPAAEVEPLRAGLRRVVEGPATAIEVLGQTITRKCNDSVLKMPEVRVTGGRWQWSERVVAYTPDVALHYALSLVVDPGKEFGRQLRCCTYPPCGRFQFVEPRTTRGQPPNHYCSIEHEAAHTKQRHRERKAASRAGISVMKYRRRTETKARARTKQ